MFNNKKWGSFPLQSFSGAKAKKQNLQEAEACHEQLVTCCSYSYNVLNPFDPALDSAKFHNLASGSTIADNTEETSLTVEKCDWSMMDKFCKRLSLHKKGEIKLFSDLVKHALRKSFGEAGEIEKLSANGKSKEIIVQQNVLGLLAAKFQQPKSSVDIKIRGVLPYFRATGMWKDKHLMVIFDSEECHILLCVLKNVMLTIISTLKV